MAITRSQQAKQMLQDGGMLVKPGFGGMRQGYRGDAAAAAGAPGTADAGPAGDPGEGPASGQGPASDNRSDFMGSKGKTRGPSNVGNVGSVLSPAAPRLIRNALINQALRKAFGPVGPIVGGVVGAMSRSPRGLPGTSEEDDDTQSFAGGGLAQLDTNRLAVKLLADGGFLGEEDRQAYGLGSIVKKVFRPVKKVAKGVTGAFKKVI